MSKRRIIVRRRTRWTVEEWERGWNVALSRIEGAPTMIAAERIFQDCVTVLDAAFSDGSGLRFEFGLNALVDFCSDSVSDGDCERWWSSE
jgi:hypothetical protein